MTKYYVLLVRVIAFAAMVCTSFGTSAQTNGTSANYDAVGTTPNYNTTIRSGPGPRVTATQLSRDSTSNTTRATSAIVVTTGSACASGPISWASSGNTCDASYPGGFSGTSTTVFDVTAPTTGSATASCTNGVATASGTCNLPAACIAASVNWTVGVNSCAASYAGGASGSAVSVSDLVAPTTGAATATCNAGVVALSATTCAVTAATCPAQSVNWSQAGNTCDGSYGGGASSSVDTVTDSTLPTSGSASVTCTNGVIAVSGGVCAVTASTCGAQSVSWLQGVNVCDGVYAGGSSGTSGTVNDTSAPTLGSATSTCTNGVASTVGTCAQATVNCAAGQSLQWVTNSALCTGTSSAGYTNNSISVAATGVNTGVASFVCNSNGSFTVTGSPTCGAGGSSNGGASCGSVPAGTAWFAGDGFCASSDPTPNLLSGQSIQVVDNSGLYKGNATATCNNGTLNVINSSCARVANGTPACAVASGTWTVGGVTCAGSIQDADLGIIVTVTDNQLGSDGGTVGATGTSEYQCQSNGQWGRTSTPNTCVQTAVVCSAVNPVAWSVGGNSCASALPQVASGQGANIVNTNSTSTGNATFICNSSGQFVQQPGATCSANPQPCPQVDLTWGLGYNTGCSSSDTSTQCCSATFPAMASGQSMTVSDYSGYTTGSAQVTCTNGNRGYPSYSCSSSYTPPPPPPVMCSSIAAGSYAAYQVSACPYPNTNEYIPALTAGSNLYVSFPGSNAVILINCNSSGGISVVGTASC